MPRGDVRRHPPEHVRPAETAVGAVDVLLLVGVGVVPAVVGDPADRAPLRGAAADGRQDIFEPLRPGQEAAVRQQPVIGHADAEPAGDPVQHQADHHRRPAEIGRHEGQQGTDVQRPDPDQRTPGDVSRTGTPRRRRRCRHAEPFASVGPGASRAVGLEVATRGRCDRGPRGTFLRVHRTTAPRRSSVAQGRSSPATFSGLPVPRRPKSLTEKDRHARRLLRRLDDPTPPRPARTGPRARRGGARSPGRRHLRHRPPARAGVHGLPRRARPRVRRRRPATAAA